MVEVSAEEQRVWDVLHQVKDPEIPVVDVVGMGIVRAVELADQGLTVTITPTYSGCPAMHVIEKEIQQALTEAGYEQVTVHTVISPAWTTDWMSEPAKEALRDYGIAPPKATCAATRSPFETPDMNVACPFCGSNETALRSRFGSTACKALHFCASCQQPFESFKCI